MSQRTVDAHIVDDLATLISDFEGSLTAATRRRVSRVGREYLEAFIAEQLSRLKPATAFERYRARAQLFKWLDEEGDRRGG